MHTMNQISVLRQGGAFFNYHIFQPANIITKNNNFNFMIIDDNKKDIELFEDLLLAETQLKFSLSKCLNPSEAMDMLEKKHIKPDIIFLDLIMPNINGAILIKKLKASAFTKTIPIIIHSSMNNYENIKKIALLDGAIAFFAKPINAIALETYLLKKT